MQLKFDHIALRAKEPEEMKNFLCALGFKEGERPDFPFEGAWLYSDEKPLIHIFGAKARFRDTDAMGNLSESKHVVDHICFASDDYEATIKNIRKHGFRHSDNIVPDSNIAQIFIMGPENLIVEIQAKI